MGFKVNEKKPLMHHEVFGIQVENGIIVIENGHL